MKQVKIDSDYAPGTSLRITQTDDGDIVLRIHGDGEMRIATSGGQFHGKQLVTVMKLFSAIIDAANKNTGR